MNDSGVEVGALVELIVAAGVVAAAGGVFCTGVFCTPEAGVSPWAWVGGGGVGVPRMQAAVNTATAAPKMSGFITFNTRTSVMLPRQLKARASDQRKAK